MSSVGRGGSPPGRRRLALLLPTMGGGGAERVALRLIDHFLEAGHEVDLVLMLKRGELLDLLPEQVKVFDLAAPKVRFMVAPLVRYFKERNPHAIQVRMWPITTAAVLAHRLAKSKSRLILSDHVALSQHYSGLSRKFLQLTVRLSYPLADKRILVSEGAADDLARLSGLDRSTFDVIYNPLPVPAPGLASTAEIESLWGSDGARILTVGNLKPQKNHALLIRSFAALRRHRPAKLMILGDGPLRPQLEALAASLQIADDVLFRGYTIDPWAFYASAHVFVLSSDYEGFGNVLVEAMRCGLTVVSTDCMSGPREILADGAYGNLVPVGDQQALAEAMQEALRRPMDPALLRSRAEELSGVHNADKYLKHMLGDDRKGC